MDIYAAVTNRIIEQMEQGINQPLQLDIFNDAERREKRRALDNAVDDLRSRFGYHTLCAASLMGENKLAQDKCETVLMPGLMYK